MLRWSAVAWATVALLTTHAAAAAPPLTSAPPPRYAPDFRHFGVYDYLGTALISGSYYVVELTQHGPRGADWTAPLPLDRPLRDAVAASSKSGREQADRWSDRFWYASVAYPVLDAFFTPAIRSRSLVTSAQMSLMNLQSFTLVSLLIRMPHKWIGRLRPDSIGCESDPTYTDHCGNNGLYVSFPGGHVAVSMTGAGLSCAHHLHAHLYGSPLADGVACGAALTVAGTVGYFRMRADKHWLSDQLAGTLTGLFSGYLVPTLLYYHPFWETAPRRSAQSAPSPRSHWAVLPWLSQDTLGAAFTVVD